MGGPRRHPGGALTSSDHESVVSRELPGRQRTIVTYLEMRAPPEELRAPTLPFGVEVRRVAFPSTDFYRFLYRSVGSKWHWTERLVLGDPQLRSIIQDDAVEVNVLYRAGAPAGYVELDYRRWSEVELAYFGLFPEALGQRLGTLFLRWTVAHVWRRRPDRFWVHTCDLDHPRALALYERVGFRIYRRSEESVPALSTSTTSPS